MTTFAFDLDGTVTCVETLPLLATELGLADEMRLLTELTLRGKIPFDKSFTMRWLILKNIPPQRIRKIMDGVALDEDIAAFIRRRRESCAIVTGNLDSWIEPIVDKLGCRLFSSTTAANALQIQDKGAAIRELKNFSDRVIAIGDGFNDVPMFQAADISVAYGGVHPPAAEAVAAADYVIGDGKSLCRLLASL
ncbi:MAG: HAD-IB family phosphatase [Quinella sp. 2Q5]|nr:HAD-IB family phosphatase [Quinella sp. 2Q5]